MGSYRVDDVERGWLNKEKIVDASAMAIPFGDNTIRGQGIRDTDT